MGGRHVRCRPGGFDQEYLPAALPVSPRLPVRGYYDLKLNNDSKPLVNYVLDLSLIYLSVSPFFTVGNTYI
jgi:hypothetical protein